MKQFIKDFTYIDLSDVNALAVDVIKLPDDQYNAQLVFLSLNDDNAIEGGFVQRTSIVTSNLKDMSNHIESILQTGVYDHLAIIDEGAAFNMEGEKMFDFVWTDYLTNTAVSFPEQKTEVH